MTMPRTTTYLSDRRAFDWALAGFLIWTAFQRLALIRNNFALDAQIYVGATKAWLAGQDPWAFGPAGYQFNAPPPSLIPMVPFALLPGDVGAAALIATCIAAAFLIVRRLGLPWYWLAFTPLVDGVWVGNPDVLVVAAIVAGAPWLGSLFKLYGLIPSAFTSRRQVLIAVAVLLATAPFVPWVTFIDEASTILVHHEAQNSEAVGTWSVPILVIPTVIALLAIPPREAAWLVVPTLWPVVNLHYATFMLPVAHPIFALLMSSDRQGLSSLAVILYAAWQHQQRLSRWLLGITRRRRSAVHPPMLDDAQRQ